MDAFNIRFLVEYTWLLLIYYYLAITSEICQYLLLYMLFKVALSLPINQFPKIKCNK